MQLGMKWISVIVLSLSIWGWRCEIAQAAEPRMGSSFKQWCLERENLSAEARNTVDVLLENAGTSDCERANENLSSRTELVLSSIGNPITDISPLAGLSNLTTLYLFSNQIKDVSPLSGLSNLTDLYLDCNQITDISPLAKLSKLTKLFISSNQITDVSPLAELSNLTTLYLIENEITDVSPLSELSHLTWLELQDNPIAQPNCPISPSGICRF